MVFSIDLTITRSLGVIGELACLRGLKFKITFKILFAVWGRARIRMDREFRVASTRTASLHMSVSHRMRECKETDLIFSWKTANILSNKPDASASRFLGGMRGLLGGTMERETSRGSPRCDLTSVSRPKHTIAIYPYHWVSIWASRLYQYDSLGKFNAAYPYTCSSCIPYP